MPTLSSIDFSLNILHLVSPLSFVLGFPFLAFFYLTFIFGVPLLLGVLKVFSFSFSFVHFPAVGLSLTLLPVM
jgi:hypothetical protein